MEKSDVSDLGYFFSRYSASYYIEASPKVVDLGPSSQRSYQKYYAGGKVTLEINFWSEDSFKKFVDDLRKVEDMYDEERFRNENPALQKLYDEYRLLFKLMK